MSDLASLSNEELLSLYQKKSGGGPLSGMSDDQLRALYEKTKVPPDTGGGIADWLASRVINAGSSFAGQTRGLADLMQSAGEKVGLPANVARAALNTNPVSLVGRFMPSTEDFKSAGYKHLPVKETNTPGVAGKAVDAGIEAMIQAPAFPGSIVRNLLPAFVGGAASEVAGQATHGTSWELPARIAAGLVGGGGAAVAQNTAGSVAKGVTNLVGSNARNVDKQAARIVGNALANDGTTAAEVMAAHQAFPQGTPLAVAGGENVRGALRGSVAAPGPARTAAADAFENYRVGGDARVGAAIDSNVSNLPPVTIRANELATQRATASTPAYEAAGVPSRIAPTGEVTAGPMFANGRPIPVAEQTPARIFNTPNLTSAPVMDMLANSRDVQAAIATARRLPEYKDLPANSMVMLDKAYKHIGGMESAAIRAGNGERARDLGNLRRGLAEAITAENPQYGVALATYSEPSQLIKAGNLGRELFAKNVNPQETRRVFAGMPDDQKKEFLGGVADWLRTRAANSDRATAGERVWNNQNIRERLRAVLPDEQYAAFNTTMEQEAQGGRAFRDIFRGSRTAPMALEAADNASQIGSVGLNLLRGRIGQALMGSLQGAAERIGEGRTPMVNNRVAQALTDPAQFQSMAGLADRQRQIMARTRANRINALATGGLLPAAMSPGLLEP